MPTEVTSLRRPLRGRVWLAAAVVVAPLLLSDSLEGQGLRVCFRDDDSPRAQRKGESGFDVAVLRAVVAELGGELQPMWLPSRSPFSEIERSDLPLAELARGDCDAVASVPGRAALGPFARVLALTAPYYGASFELLADNDVPATLESLTGYRIGVRLQTLAHFEVQRLGLSWKARPTTAEVVALFDAGEVDAALVWGPALAPFGRRPRADFVPPPALRFDEHIAMRRDDGRLERVNGALIRLADEGRIGELAAAEGMIVHPPFAADPLERREATESSEP